MSTMTRPKYQDRSRTQRCQRQRWQLWVMMLIASIVPLVPADAAEPRQPERQPHADRYTFADGHISFVAPPGFNALPADWLAFKYPRAGAPRQAVGNATLTTSIAYDLFEQRAPSQDLDALRRAVQENYAQLPNLRWVASDVRRVGDRDWAYMEFTAAASDEDIHNIVLLSVYDGRLLIFNFNSTVVEFPRVDRALRASMATIKITP